MSLRVRTPTADTANDGVGFRDEDPPSTSKARSSKRELWSPAMTSMVLRTVALLVLSSAVVGISYSAMATTTTSNTAVHENARRREQTNNNDNEKQCTIFMAPSSLKGLDGYGIFTTRDIPKDESIFAEQDGPSIPVIDYKNSGDWIKTWNEYLWGRGISDQLRVLGDSVMDLQVGFGSLPNHHCILHSLSHRYPTPDYHDALVKRGDDPGTGAFSYSMGREFYAKKPLQAGDEIFLNYGYCQRDPHKHKKSHAWANDIPMEEDYAEAANIAWAFLQLPNDEDVRVTIPKGTNPFVASLLPKSTRHLQTIVGSTKVTRPKDLIPLLAKHLATTPRTPDWIRKNGLCLENLVACKSTLKHAGQGGFAQHHIQKGEIVVPAPLIQIVDKESLLVPSDDGKPSGWQLLLNYCFGHEESTMLLCPDTNALLINHCSERKNECGPSGPNAEYRWSTGWEPRSDEWRKLSLKEIRKQTGRGLSMEIVALRDIEPGEEVTFDYGVEWERAWEEHVKSWKPPQTNTTQSTVSVKEANEQTSLELLVTGDLRKVSEHPYLFTGCQYWPSDEDESKVYKKERLNWEAMDNKEILHRFADSGRSYRGGNYKTHRDKTYWPCSVLRQESKGSYTVRIHQADWADETMWHVNKVPRLLKNYPRESIHYFVKPYASDQDLPGVFRQPIGLRDEIFPEQWKNLKT